MVCILFKVLSSTWLYFDTPFSHDSSYYWFFKKITFRRSFHKFFWGSFTNEFPPFFLDNLHFNNHYSNDLAEEADSIVVLKENIIHCFNTFRYHRQLTSQYYLLINQHPGYTVFKIAVVFRMWVNIFWILLWIPLN